MLCMLHGNLCNRFGGRIHEYEAGTWGPVAADKLIAKQGKVWRKPTGLMKKKV